MGKTKIIIDKTTRDICHVTMEHITVFEVYPANPTHIVRVNDDVYEMSAGSCTLPNDVNMYAGVWEDWKSRMGGIKPLEDIPVNIVIGWLRRCEIYEMLED